MAISRAPVEGNLCANSGAPPCCGWQWWYLKLVVTDHRSSSHLSALIRKVPWQVPRSLLITAAHWNSIIVVIIAVGITSIQCMTMAQLCHHTSHECESILWWGPITMSMRARLTWWLIGPATGPLHHLSNTGWEHNYGCVIFCIEKVICSPS